MSDVYNTFRGEYTQFRQQRDTLFGLEGAPKKEAGEANIDFLLRLAEWCLENARKNSDLDQVLIMLRSSTDSCMETIVGHIRRLDGEISDDLQQSLENAGYCEITNVYLIAALVHGVNWAVLKNIDVKFSSWIDVILLSLDAGNTNINYFLHMYYSVHAKKGDDPFPEADVKNIRSAIDAFKEDPKSISEGLAKRRSPEEFEKRLDLVLKTD